MQYKSFLFCLVALLLLSCGDNNVNSVQPKYSLNATDLNTEFRINEIAAESKYKGQVIEIVGNISQIQKVFGKPTVILNNNDAQCEFGDESQVSNLKPGQTIRVKGVCGRLAIISVMMYNCVIVEDSPPQKIEEKRELAKDSTVYATSIMKISSEYFGSYHGIQPSYFVKNKYGTDLIVNGQKVPVPSIDFIFLLKENNTVSLQQTSLEDNSRYYYEGRCKIINETTNDLTIECTLSDGKSNNPSTPTYYLVIEKSNKKGNCSGHNEPQFIIEKTNPNSSSNTNPQNTNSQLYEVNESNSQVQSRNTEEEQNYQPGYYITNGSSQRKVYFHNRPDATTKRKAYIDSQETVLVEKIVNGFAYIEIFNEKGQKSIGWISMNDLILKP